MCICHSMNSQKFSVILTRLNVLAVCALVALLIISPILATGSWYKSHDGIHSPYLMLQFRESFVQGNWYPRWMPELLGGYGYPALVFYQPAYFYFTLPFTYFTDILAACYWSLLFALTLGMLGGYKLARLWLPAGWAIGCAILFLLSPYIAINLFVRCDLSELYAMLVCPWQLYFLFTLAYAIQRQQSAFRPALYVMLSTALIIITHPFVAFWWLPVAGGLWIVLSFFPQRNYQLLWVGMLSMALAVVLTAPYWWTILQMKEYVQYWRAINWEVLNQTFGNKISLFNVNDATAFAWLYIVAAVMGFALTWRKHFSLYGMLIIGLYIFLMSTFSIFIWQVGWEILRYTQFVWRLRGGLTIISYLGIIQLAVMLRQFSCNRRLRPAWSLAIAILSMMLCIFLAYSTLPLGWMIGSSDHLEALDFYQKANHEEKKYLYTSDQTAEFLPIHADPSKLANRYTHPIPLAQFMLPAPAESTLEETETSSPYRIEADIGMRSPGGVLINQLYFPGWKATANGQPVFWREDATQEVPTGYAPGVVAEPLPSGKIVIRIQRPDNYRVALWYDGPPGWQWRNAVILVLGAGLMWALWRQTRIARAA